MTTLVCDGRRVLSAGVAALVLTACGAASATHTHTSTAARQSRTATSAPHHRSGPRDTACDIPNENSSRVVPAAAGLIAAVQTHDQISDSAVLLGSSSGSAQRQARQRERHATASQRRALRAEVAAYGTLRSGADAARHGVAGSAQTISAGVNALGPALKQLLRACHGH